MSYFFDYTPEQRRAFVLKHVLRLTHMQAPSQEEKYRDYVMKSEEAWIDENFQRFAKNYAPQEMEVIKRML